MTALQARRCLPPSRTRPARAWADPIRAAHGGQSARCRRRRRPHTRCPPRTDSNWLHSGSAGRAVARGSARVASRRRSAAPPVAHARPGMAHDSAVVAAARNTPPTGHVAPPQAPARQPFRRCKRVRCRAAVAWVSIVGDRPYRTPGSGTREAAGRRRALEQVEPEQQQWGNWRRCRRCTRRRRSLPPPQSWQAHRRCRSWWGFADQARGARAATVGDEVPSHTHAPARQRWRRRRPPRCRTGIRSPGNGGGVPQVSKPRRGPQVASDEV